MLMNSGNWFDQRLADGGPMYMETHPGHLIVEPWNCFSSFLMLIPAMYWIYRMKKDGRQDKLMWAAIILVVAGGLGSALFHGLRISYFFLIMDILPSAVLTLTLTIYFWIRILNKWWHVFFIIVPLLGSRFLFWGVLPEHATINLSYFITGVGIGLPLIIFLFRTHFSAWKIVLSAIFFFIIALIFRQVDNYPITFLPMGTHFLWHTFSAVGTFFILDFLYNIRKSHRHYN